jgi:translation initiation factor 2-alpha kinase 3
MLGRGGYGIVYHVRHRLDNQVYAVKKVPISTPRLHRIQKRGEAEVQEVLRELRTLASLDHPNVVRYFNGWIEWVDSVAPPALAEAQSATRSPMFSQDPEYAHSGAEDSGVETLGQVVTEDGLGDAGIVFETSASASVQTKFETSVTSVGSAENGDYRLRRVGTRSTIATVSDETAETVELHVDPSISLQSVQSTASGVHFAEPTLALHMQMAMYPMSLAEFLAPATTVPLDPHVAPPLVHCFHLEPSINILLAILNGVEYLHGQDIVHRDIKPANIFLGPHSNLRPSQGSVNLMSCTDCHIQNTPNPIRLEVRIGDFGLVTVADPDSNASPPSEAVGTEIYRPPTATARHSSLDIYALGIVAFELLCKFNTRMERLHTLQQLKQGEFPVDFGKDWGMKVGEAMKECIGSMLAQDGNAVSISELKQKLTAILSMREHAARSLLA